MPAIPESGPAVAPSVIAGLLLVAREHQLRLRLPAASVEQIIEHTGATRSCAYEIRARLLPFLGSVVRPVGRPPAMPAPGAAPSAARKLTELTLRFVMDHPGCVTGSANRRDYSSSFRRFVLDQHGTHTDLDLPAFATAVAVPVDTLRDWLRVPTPAQAPSASPSPGNSGPQSASPPPDGSRPASLHIETVLAEWKKWHGGFVPFCDHVQQHLRVPFGRTALAAILLAHGARRPAKRPGRSPDESGLRKAFETFFPGAQWVGDGKTVVVSFRGERFVFNLELLVDAYTGAFTGASIRDTEDSAAVIEAMADGKATTGQPPLALLLDNRPSNATPEVRDALAPETQLIPATLFRAQNKAHVEGAFGLFSQTVPALVVSAPSNREAARELLRLVVITWGRAVNGRPRADRAGKSRTDLYAEKPTPEQVEQARAALTERLRRLQLARQTTQARQDPIVRTTLAAAFQRLCLADPEGHLLDAIARYPLSPVVNGIAIFEGKRAAGTLPPDVDARYLLGIVRRISDEQEATQISEHMLRLRLEARDAVLTPLPRALAELQQRASTAGELLRTTVDRACESLRTLDRIFWLTAASDVIRNAPMPAQSSLYRTATRQVAANSQLPKAERLNAVGFLADHAIPLH